MKKRLITLFMVLILFVIATGLGSSASTSSKVETTRAIAIVFDNSGSMYSGGNKAWCQATYAMEVFASMLNSEDILQIYPMWPIEVNGKEYTMEQPFEIKGSSQASAIREIYTPSANTTPIESIDCAIEGIKKVDVDKKYLVVLTDGESFFKNGFNLSLYSTIEELDLRFKANASKDLSIMYLGIGRSPAMPSMSNSEYFIKKNASSSAAVLSTLTELCNLIFGRDTLPKNRISGKTVEFDISMKRLIVFVQGENVSDLSVSNSSGEVGTRLNSTSTKYGTAGCGTYYNNVYDSSLQGMMITYENCDAGTYDINFSGNATSIEVYYEPDAALDFVFTEANGQEVDPSALYEGDYKVSFGMKDAKTGKLISSDLLGDTVYSGSYSVNGKTTSISHKGYSGEVPISLKMNDSFDATLTVTYLSGYTITKNTTDFGWPSGGINVVPKPPKDFRLEVTGGDEENPLKDLEAGTPYIVKVYYDDELLTSEELKKVILTWDEAKSNAKITCEIMDDHYVMTLHYKDPASPTDTVCGACTVGLTATYTPPSSSEAKAEENLKYNITDDFAPLKIKLDAPDSYIVISELEESRAVVAKITAGGKPLSEEVFNSLNVNVECDIKHTVTPCPEDSSYLIKLMPTEGISEDDYKISVSASYTDKFDRTTEAESETSVTLSHTPLWLKWLISILFILILIIIILIILHIKVLPSRAHANKRDCKMIVDGEDVSKSTSFTIKIEKRQAVVQAKYGGAKTGLSMEAKPGKESYLRKSQTRRTAEIKSSSVRKTGMPVVHEAIICGIRYSLNEENGKLERMPKNEKPFLLKHGSTISYSGTMLSAGSQKSFTVSVKMNYKK